MSYEPAAEAAAEWWSVRLKRGDREAFRKSLRESVLTILLEDGKCFLDCDHDPCGPLLDAVEAAGVECSGHGFSAIGILPSKTSLEVTMTTLRPKEGYGRLTDPIYVRAA